MEGGPRDRRRGRGHTLRVDEPPEFGGGDTGPMPTEMLVVALASCFCLAVAWAARKKHIELEDLRVSVQPHRVVGEPRHGSYDVWVESSTPAEQLAPAVDLAKRYCWVTNTIAHPAGDPVPPRRSPPGRHVNTEQGVELGQRICVIGGGAAGISAASMAKRTNPDATVVICTEFEDVAYSPCGIPYVLGREIPDFERLFLAGPENYEQAGIDLRRETVVTEVDARTGR